MGDQTKSSKTDWGNLQSYLGGDCPADVTPQPPPKIITEGVFHFTEELIDQNGESIEPEVTEDTFIDWLEGLKPHGANVSYSTQKVPYLLAVYAAVPEWLGCDEAFMEEAYGYTPEALTQAFSAQKGPNSAEISHILDGLITQAKVVLDSHDAEPQQSGQRNWWEEPPAFEG